MAKRKNQWSEEKIARLQKDGRGSGELSNYKPWLTIQDVPSSGRVHRIKGWKTSRIHHLLSDLERNYFFILEWADEVIDIREQFPLERERTIQIAEEIQIKHPIDNSTQTPIVLTTDFFITLRKKNTIIYIARTTKPSDLLNDKRVIEKFELERVYWEEKGVSWGIVTEKDIPYEIVKNVEWIHSSYELSDSINIELAMEFYNIFKKSNDSIIEALRSFDKAYNLQNGSGLSLLKHLLAIKKVQFNIKETFNVSNSMDCLMFEDLKPKGERLAT